MSKITKIDSDQIKSLAEIGIDEFTRKKIEEVVIEGLNNFFEKGDLDGLNFTELLVKNINIKIFKVLDNDYFRGKLNSIAKTILKGIDLTKILGKKVNFEVFPTGSSFAKIEDENIDTKTQENVEHPDKFLRKYWTMHALKELGINYELKSSKERKDKTESYGLFFVPEYNCVIAVADQYGKATYFLPMKNWQKLAKSRKIDDLRPDDNVEWLAMPSGIRGQEEWGIILSEKLLEIQGKSIKIEEKEAISRDFEKKETRIQKANRRANELITFLNKNKRLPTRRNKSETSLIYFYHNNKNSNKITKALKNKMKKEWDSYRKLDPQYLRKKSKELIDFLEKNPKIPKEKTSLEIFFKTNRNNKNIPAELLKKMNKLWDLKKQTAKNQENIMKINRLLNFMENNFCMPSFSSKNDTELSLARFFIRNKDNPNFTNMKEWGKIINLQQEILSKNNNKLEKKALDIISFIEKYKKIPQHTSFNLEEVHMSKFFYYNKNNLNISEKIRTKMNLLWNQYKRINQYK